ncbi:MAG: hypothetical protein AAB438_01525 [Patescibacteria group bacterium]
MDTKNLLKIKISVFTFVFVSTFLFFSFSTVNAANLRINSGSLSLPVGNTTTLSVLVNSEGVAVNNAEGTISFPSDLFEVLSVSKSGSVFSLWIEEPSFSNSSGIIAFNGGVPTPGFNGSAGKVISFVVRAKKTGQGEFIFSSSVVRANDGLGTDILSSKNTSTIQIQPSTPKEVEVVQKEIKPISNSTLQTPSITSSTHPDQEIWYASTTATFNWNIPSTATSIQTAFNKVLDSVPSITYDSSVSQKTLTSLPDRVFYFHLRYQDGGKWSPVAHYKFKVDATSPEVFTPSVRDVGNNNLLKLDAVDATSGIDHYTIQIDETPTFTVRTSDLTNNEYVLPILKEGQHDIAIVAFDKAGNKREVKTTFINAFEITSPEIKVEPTDIFVGNTVNISGKTNYPNTEVTITVVSGEKEINLYSAITDIDGMFTLATNKIKTVGIYNVSAVNTVGENIASDPSETVQFKVNDKDMLKLVINKYHLIAVGIGIVLLLILLILGWAKYLMLRRKIKNGGAHPVENVYKATLLLKEELDKQLKVLEKIKTEGSMNEKEEKVLNDIQKKEEIILNDIQKK